MRILNDEELWEVDKTIPDKPANVKDDDWYHERYYLKAQFEQDIKDMIKWVDKHTVLMVESCGVITYTFHCTAEEWESFGKLVENNT